MTHTAQTRVQAQLLLADKDKLGDVITSMAVQAVDYIGVKQVKSSILDITTRKCSALIWGQESYVFDILVVEVPIFARRRGILKFYLHALLWHALVGSVPPYNFVLRFHNVVSMELQDWLCRHGFVLDGDYFCHFNISALQSRLAALQSTNSLLADIGEQA